MRLGFRRKGRRGALMVAIVFLLFAALLALAFHTLLPMEMWSTLQSRQRHTGSLASEAGVAEAVLYLQAGNTPTSATPDVDSPTLVSQSGDLAGGWSYRVWLEDPAATGAAGVWRATSDALHDGKAYMRAVAHLGGPNGANRDFFEQVRVGGNMSALAGPNVQYYDGVHANGSLEIEMNGYGWGSPQNFHQAATWSNPTLTEPTVNNHPGATVQWSNLTDMLVDPANDANDDASALSAGFSQVSDRTVPVMDPSDPDNIISGTSNSESILNLTLNGTVAPTSGVNLIAGGGVYIAGSDVAKISLRAITDASDLTSIITPTHDNLALTNQWGLNNPSNFHQLMTIELTSGEVYTVLYDRTADQTKLWLPADPTTGAPSQTIAGLTNGMVYSENRLDAIEGVNLGRKTFAASEIKVQFDNQLAPLYRADVEPSEETWITQDPYLRVTRRPFTGNHSPGYEGDGITLATTGDVTYEIPSGYAPPVILGRRHYYTYANVLAHGDVKYQNDALALFYFNLVGSVAAEGNFQISRDHPNKGFRFRQDPTNLSYKEATGSAYLPVFNYHEKYFRGGR